MLGLPRGERGGSFASPITHDLRFRRSLTNIYKIRERITKPSELAHPFLTRDESYIRQRLMVQVAESNGLLQNMSLTCDRYTNLQKQTAG